MTAVVQFIDRGVEPEQELLDRVFFALSDPVRRAAYDAELAAAGGTRGNPVVTRETRALAVLLRALSLVIAVVFLARLVPFVWRTVLRGLGIASEALGAPVGVLAAAAGVFAVVGPALGIRARRSRERG